MLETANADEKAKLIAAYADISRLEETAALDAVKSMREVVKPVTQ